MQFVFNHTTFDLDNPMDQAVLAAYKPLARVYRLSSNKSVNIRLA